ncbi:MAG TPA: hypothetical protein PKC21_02730 [Oligoflexia bacterium]|nr:hypothetical protein [Oligoflexia bacterium]HMR24247.1 hypothetical protein [Oligoflexia bacterium]
MLKEILTENAWLNLALVAQLFTGAVFLGVLAYVFNKKNKEKLTNESTVLFYEELKQ